MMPIYLLPLLFTCSFSAAQRLQDVPLPEDYCKNGGFLRDNKCECTLRYEGPSCETERCLNGGRRYSVNGEVKCKCPYGLTGDKCEQVTYCESGKGALKNGKCVCEKAYTGTHCQERPCYNGIPTGEKDGLCLCEVGFTGPFCEEKLICQHGGYVNNENECKCRTGYTGDHCELCAMGFLFENGNCVPEVSESSLLAQSSTFASRSFTWPVLLLAGGAATIVILIIAASIFMVKKWTAKPSRVSSVQGDPTEGTDV